MDGWMDGWMDGCMHACMHACMEGMMDGRTNEWINGWVTEGEMFTSISEALSSSFSSDNGEGTLAITSLRGCPFRLISCKRSTIAE